MKVNTLSNFIKIVVQIAHSFLWILLNPNFVSLNEIMFDLFFLIHEIDSQYSFIFLHQSIKMIFKGCIIFLIIAAKFQFFHKKIATFFPENRYTAPNLPERTFDISDSNYLSCFNKIGNTTILLYSCLLLSCSRGSKGSFGYECYLDSFTL